MASFWDLLRASWSGQPVDPYFPFAAPQAAGSKGATPSVPSADPLSASNTDDQTQPWPTAFLGLPPPLQPGQRFAPIMPTQAQRGPDPWLVAAPQASVSEAASPSVAPSGPPGGWPDANDRKQPSPKTYWDLLPATQLGQSFAPIMPTQAQGGADPWLVAMPQAGGSKAAAPAMVPWEDNAQPSAQGTLASPARTALGQSASGAEQSSATPAGVLGAAAQDRATFLAPWSASHGLLDYPVIGPVAGLGEYLMRGAAQNWRDNQWRDDEEATAPNRYYLPRAGERSPPSRYSAAPVGDALAGAIAAPFVAIDDMMQPPLRPPPDSVSDDSGQIWIKSRPDSATHDVPWEEAAPDAARAYYADQQRRADFAPRFALGMIGGGAGFATRGALGIAGGRLVRPSMDAAKLARKIKRADSAAPASTTGVPRVATSASTEAAETAEGPSRTAVDSASAPVSSPADGLPSPSLARLMLTGQNHHAVSKRVYNALEKTLNLPGVFRYRDPRLMTRAIDSDSHRGYQTWHRNLDNEIAAHIRGNLDITREQFEQYLRDRYAQPDLLSRFPNGL